MRDSLVLNRISIYCRLNSWSESHFCKHHIWLSNKWPKCYEHQIQWLGSKQTERMRKWKRRRLEGLCGFKWGYPDQAKEKAKAKAKATSLPNSSRIHSSENRSVWVDLKLHKVLVDLRGVQGTYAPCWPKLLHFHAVFRSTLRLTPFLELAGLPLGNSRSVTGKSWCWSEQICTEFSYNVHVKSGHVRNRYVHVSLNVAVNDQRIHLNHR